MRARPPPIVKIWALRKEIERFARPRAAMAMIRRQFAADGLLAMGVISRFVALLILQGDRHAAVDNQFGTGYMACLL